MFMFSLSYIIVEKILHAHNSNTRLTVKSVIEPTRKNRILEALASCSVVRTSDQKILGSFPGQGYMPWLWA